MFSYRQYQKLYPDTTFKKWFKYVVIDIWIFIIKKYLWDWIPASILCIRYPFLYPRNRWTGYHWHSYKILNASSLCYSKAVQFDIDYNVHIVRWDWMILHYILNGVHKVLQVFHCIPYYTELDFIPEGWKPLALEMYAEIKKVLIQEGGIKRLLKFRILDQKEKWGYLNVYCNEKSLKIYQIITKYEDLSKNICIRCGTDITGDNRYLSSTLPLCKKCATKISEKNNLFTLK